MLLLLPLAQRIASTGMCRLRPDLLLVPTLLVPLIWAGRGRTAPTLLLLLEALNRRPPARILLRRALIAC